MASLEKINKRAPPMSLRIAQANQLAQQIQSDLLHCPPVPVCRPSAPPPSPPRPGSPPTDPRNHPKIPESGPGDPGRLASGRRGRGDGDSGEFEEQGGAEGAFAVLRGARGSALWGRGDHESFASMAAAGSDVQSLFAVHNNIPSIRHPIRAIRWRYLRRKPLTRRPLPRCHFGNIY